MSGRFSPSLPATAFFAAVGVLALILFVEWLPGGAAVPTGVPPAKPVHASEADPAQEEARDTGEWVDTVLQRPLFSIGRRPAKNAAKPGMATPTGLPRLSGIIITASGRRAIFMPDTGKAQYLAEGASLDDQVIRLIAPGRVTLTGPKGDLVLRPTYDPKRPVGGPTTPMTQAFGQPQFPNGMPMGIPAPGFNQGVQLPQPQATDESGDAAPPPMPGQPILQPGMPVFRPMPPHGRE